MGEKALKMTREEFTRVFAQPRDMEKVDLVDREVQRRSLRDTVAALGAGHELSALAASIRGIFILPETTPAQSREKQNRLKAQEVALVGRMATLATQISELELRADMGTSQPEDAARLDEHIELYADLNFVYVNMVLPYLAPEEPIQPPNPEVVVQAPPPAIEVKKTIDVTNWPETERPPEANQLRQISDHLRQQLNTNPNYDPRGQGGGLEQIQAARQAFEIMLQDLSTADYRNPTAVANYLRAEYLGDGRPTVNQDNWIANEPPYAIKVERLLNLRVDQLNDQERTAGIAAAEAALIDLVNLRTELNLPRPAVNVDPTQRLIDLVTFGEAVRTILNQRNTYPELANDAVFNHFQTLIPRYETRLEELQEDAYAHWEWRINRPPGDPDQILQFTQLRNYLTNLDTTPPLPAAAALEMINLAANWGAIWNGPNIQTGNPNIPIPVINVGGRQVFPLAVHEQNYRQFLQRDGETDLWGRVRRWQVRLEFLDYQHQTRDLRDAIQTINAIDPVTRNGMRVEQLEQLANELVAAYNLARPLMNNKQNQLVAEDAATTNHAYQEADRQIHRYIDVEKEDVEKIAQNMTYQQIADYLITNNLDPYIYRLENRKSG